MVYAGAWGKLIHEKKNRSRKSRDTVPLKIDGNERGQDEDSYRL